MTNIIKIQALVRGFLIRYNNRIINSKYQTKHWRQYQKWYNNGKSNECELNQKHILKNILNIELKNTNKRINTENYTIIIKKNISQDINSFMYTEDFDGEYLSKNNRLYYFNLKFICGNGGAQTRSMRETFHFIKEQYNYIQKNKLHNVYFMNILDGDQNYINMDKYKYLNQYYKDIQKYIFIGDMYTFKKKYNNLD